MKKQIKIKFTGFAWYHDPRKLDYYRFLCNRYDVVESDKPDYVIDGGQNFEHVKYDALKILIDCENCVPNFDDYDYAVASCHMSFGDRYVRVPWFAFYTYFPDIERRKQVPDPSLLNRKFCSFVVSDAEYGDPIRRIFFERLSKYKRVDSGGRWRNNIGGHVKDKLAFCRQYKFNIAFENSSFPGYTTEKIMEAYVAQTVPIYYGNPTVETDFKPESMIRVSGLDDIERAVEDVVRLDQDDDAYMKMVTASCLVAENTSVYERRLENFLAHIFDQPLEQARRLCPYGYQANNRRHLKMVHGLDQWMRDSKIYNFVVGIKGKIKSARM